MGEPQKKTYQNYNSADGSYSLDTGGMATDLQSLMAQMAEMQKTQSAGAVTKQNTQTLDDARNAFFQIAQQEPAPGTPEYAVWKAKRDAAELTFQKAQAADLGTNPDGSAKKPGFQSISNPDGTLQKAYQISDWKNVNADRSALDMYKKDALRSADQQSPWAKMMLQKQGLEESNAIDQANLSGQNAGLQASMNLARSGGLSGAARERASRQGVLQQMMGAQQARNQGALARAGIGLQDEQQRQQGLQNLQGMENTQAQADYQNQLQQQGVQKTNVGNMLGETTQKRAYDANAYAEAMKAWAANKTADAQKGASGGGGKK